MKLLFNKKFKGFTLIELLIVIGVIAILAALAFVALNPLARFQDSRNAQRWTDINAILSAIKLDQVDNGGTYMTAIADLTDDTYYQIGTGESTQDTCQYPDVDLDASCVNLSGLVTDGYLASVPYDPSSGSAAETDYYVMVSSTGALTVGACTEEQGSGSTPPEIEVSR
jgi:prepilin-type N-terminal cleavage/methylation domain-containing protein